MELREHSMYLRFTVCYSRLIILICMFTSGLLVVSIVMKGWHALLCLTQSLQRPLIVNSELVQKQENILGDL